MSRFLIKNTTMEQRKQIINEALDCGGGGCENCSGCGVFGGIDPYEMYLPYIEGKKEIAQINMEFRTGFNIKG